MYMCICDMCMLCMLHVPVHVHVAPPVPWRLYGQHLLHELPLPLTLTLALPLARYYTFNAFFMTMRGKFTVLRETQQQLTPTLTLTLTLTLNPNPDPNPDPNSDPGREP